MSHEFCLFSLFLRHNFSYFCKMYFVIKPPFRCVVLHCYLRYKIFPMKWFHMCISVWFSTSVMPKTLHYKQKMVTLFQSHHCGRIYQYFPKLTFVTFCPLPWLHLKRNYREDCIQIVFKYHKSVLDLSFCSKKKQKKNINTCIEKLLAKPSNKQTKFWRHNKSTSCMMTKWHMGQIPLFKFLC